MRIFDDYLSRLGLDDRKAIQRIIDIVYEEMPEAQEGLSYGMPAFKYRGRPLIGFSANKYGLNLYPFDPRVISDANQELSDFERGKGVVRFSAQKPIPKKVILLLINLRLEYLR